ncbi:hypothetical protein L798_10603 [Zootermopsis nevadensis]|uniref:Uncharacterized protein n=1 Tax=Zootermopsis nevadensis TaxID=136037 RepID=A0A067R0X9_ZOONE|nr:hypothetical protein L798_10603 [Zootermopsis nevadensis]
MLVVSTGSGCTFNIDMASLILRFANSKRQKIPCFSVKLILSRDPDRMLVGLEDCL